MRTMNQNAAYDLSAFAPRQTEKQEVQMKLIKSDKKHLISRATAFKLGVLFVAVMIGFVVIIYNNLVLNEISAQISSANSTYTKLMSEKTRLDMELESRIALKNVEEIAEKQLGLTKASADQIEYIQVSEASGIITCSVEEENGLFNILKRNVNRFLAYIRN